MALQALSHATAMASALKASGAYSPLAQAPDEPKTTAAQVTEFMCTADLNQVEKVLTAVSKLRPGFIELALSRVRGVIPSDGKKPGLHPTGGDTPGAAPLGRQDLVVKEARCPGPGQTAGTPRPELPARITKKQDIASLRPCVQFSSPQYFCREDEDSVTLTIMRMEPLHARSVVLFRTVDATACGGEHFEHVTTEVAFEPEQMYREVRVPIVHTPQWETLLEFRAELGEVAGGNAELGHYVWHARIMLIDTDSFPSSKYDGVPPEKVGVYTLLREYRNLVLRIPSVYWGTMKGIARAVFNCFAFLAKLLLNVILVDDILNLDHAPSALFFGPDRVHKLMAMTMVLVMLFALHHFLAYRSTTFGVGGAQRLLLQKSAMRKFMNMEEDDGRNYNSALLVTMMTRDAPKVVGTGYNSIFTLTEEFGNIIAILMFQALAKFAFGKSLQPIAILPMVAIPPILFVFARLRGPTTTQILTAASTKQDAVADIVFDACENFDLISDYKRKPYFVEKLEDGIRDFHRARRQAKQRILNNEFFAPWVAQIFIAVYLVVGGLNVIDGVTSLGMFLTNVKIMQEFGAIWSRISTIVVDILEAGPALINLTHFLNRPTDSRRKLEISRSLQQASVEKCLKDYEERSPSPFAPYDTLHISCCNIDLPAGGIQMKGSLEVSQGEFVIIVGASGSGMSSLMKVLGGRWLPIDKDLGFNSFFVPSHLRVLHVASPLFFDESLMQNLTFGVADGDEDGNPERVRAICRLLKVDERFLGMLDKPFTKPWDSLMGTTDAIKLHMARAFVANPEVLVVHKPAELLRDASMHAMMSAFRDFVSQKGLLQDQSRWLSRRPRTCIITCCRESEVEYADRAYFIDRSNIIHELGPGQALPQ